MKTDIAVIVQCRISSKRLPEKALKMLGGRTVLEWTLLSMSKVKADRYFVATDENSYETLKPIVEKCGWEIFVGPLDDVLKRYCLLIEKIKCKYVLRATADNPFLFYEAAQTLCDEFKKQMSISACDYMTWTGLPHGSGVEIFNADSLLKAEKLTSEPFDREHVGPALYNHKTKFTSLFYKAPSRFYFPEYRTTIDTPADYRRALSVINCLSDKMLPNEPFTTEQILSAVKNPSVKDTILFFPCVKKGFGTGHLRRCLAAAIKIGAFVYIPNDTELEETNQLIEDFIQRGLKEYQIVNDFPQNNEYSVIVTDYFSLDLKIVQDLSKIAPVIAIDEGSEYSDWCDYLLDIIPSMELKRMSNYTEPDFIEKPKNKKNESIVQNDFENILVCLGGEDPAGLTVPAAMAFASEKNKITAIVSKIDSIQECHKKENINYIPPVYNLREELYKYDLVVTHYGLTAYEAMSAGCAVILLATTKLHGQLAHKYGFEWLSKKQLEEENIHDILQKSKKLYPSLLIKRETKSLGNFIKELSHSSRYECPVCKNQKEQPDEIISRTKTKTYRRCSTCGIIYISWSSEPETTYEKQYFSEQYKKQYGKTYLEDFDFIKKNSVHRVMEINSALRIANDYKPSVLDIGCAYGPFLSAANDMGWQVFGTDIAKDAIEYVQSKLLFPAVCANFPEFNAGTEFGINKFDAVTMWFVIEHFSNLKEVLSSVSNILKEGGVFAFSTPSGSGVSARYNRKSFFESSPSDHYTIWEPERVSKILKKFGFSVVKIVSTGHHPERFPIVVNNGWTSKEFKFKIFDKISKTLNLGDTFEVYCRKDKTQGEEK